MVCASANKDILDWILGLSRSCDKYLTAWVWQDMSECFESFKCRVFLSSLSRPAVPSLHQLTPIPPQRVTASSRLRLWLTLWPPHTLQLRSRPPGLWSRPLTRPTKATRRPQTTPTDSPIPRSQPLPHRRTRYTQTRSVSLRFSYDFCSSVSFCMPDFCKAGFVLRNFRIQMI